MSNEITRDEARHRFLEHMASLVNYWENKSRAKTSKEKLDGLLHSILVTLDGGSGEMPSYIVIPSPHESDKDYQIERGDDYYPYCSGAPKGTYDIGGALHELLNKYQ